MVSQWWLGFFHCCCHCNTRREWWWVSCSDISVATAVAPDADYEVVAVMVDSAVNDSSVAAPEVMAALDA